MLSKLTLFFIAVVALIIGLHRTLQNGSFLKFLDDHPNDKIVPAVEYYVGEGYYVMQGRQDATVFFKRLSDRYPKSSFSDDAVFNTIQILDDTSGIGRVTLIDEYTKYLARFPQGKHATEAQTRIDTYRAGS